MKELTKELKSILDKIFKDIENQIAVCQIDLHEYDLLLEPFEDDKRYKEWRERFREDIIFYKKDNIFYGIDLPQLESILSNSLSYVKLINNGKIKTSKAISPDSDIIALLQQKEKGDKYG